MDFINEAMDFINEAMDFISVHINTKDMVHNGGGPNPVIFTAMERTTKTKSRLPTADRSLRSLDMGMDVDNGITHQKKKNYNNTFRKK